MLCSAMHDHESGNYDHGLNRRRQQQVRTCFNCWYISNLNIVYVIHVYFTRFHMWCRIILLFKWTKINAHFRTSTFTITIQYNLIRGFLEKNTIIFGHDNLTKVLDFRTEYAHTCIFNITPKNIPELNSTSDWSLVYESSITAQLNSNKTWTGDKTDQDNSRIRGQRNLLPKSISFICTQHTKTCITKHLYWLHRT